MGRFLLLRLFLKNRYFLEIRLGLISRNSQAHSRLQIATRRLVMSVANSDIHSEAVESNLKVQGLMLATNNGFFNLYLCLLSP
jgi:hypothetical protein